MVAAQWFTMAASSGYMIDRQVYTYSVHRQYIYIDRCTAASATDEDD